MKMFELFDFLPRSKKKWQSFFANEPSKWQYYCWPIIWLFGSYLTFCLEAWNCDLLVSKFEYMYKLYYSLYSHVLSLNGTLRVYLYSILCQESCQSWPITNCNILIGVEFVIFLPKVSSVTKKWHIIYRPLPKSFLVTRLLFLTEGQHSFLYIIWFILLMTNRGHNFFCLNNCYFWRDSDFLNSYEYLSLIVINGYLTKNYFYY